MTIKEHAKILGQRGGKARAKNLSTQRKKEIASSGGLARSESLKISKRIEINFRYLSAIKEIMPMSKVRSLKSFNKKLPGFYVEKR